MKTCSECQILKSLEHFSKNKAQKDGLANLCKPCFSLANKEWRVKNRQKIKLQQKEYWANTYKQVAQEKYHKNPLKHRDYKLQYNFGINIEQYNIMLVRQNDCCAICKRHKSEFKQALAVDHCHETGKVRGLLCTSCNNGLGRFKDSVEITIRAASYLATGGI